MKSLVYFTMFSGKGIMASSLLKVHDNVIIF
jgi:hypothetical protein